MSLSVYSYYFIFHSERIDHWIWNYFMADEARIGKYPTGDFVE